MAMRVVEVSKPCVELALDATGREFGEQSRMPDCIESSRIVKRQDPDLMSDIERRNPLLGEQNQYVHGSIICSESKLVI